MRCVTFLLGRKNFGCHVLESAGVKVRIELVGHATDAKISDFDEHLFLGLKENIFDFEVTMNDVFAVTVGNSAGDLSEIEFGLFFGNGFPLS